MTSKAQKSRKSKNKLVTVSDRMQKGYRYELSAPVGRNFDPEFTIDIDEFVRKSSIDPRYLIRSYYLVTDGKVGHDAFAVIGETIRNMEMVAIGRLVLTSREHLSALSRSRTV